MEMLAILDACDIPDQMDVMPISDNIQMQRHTMGDRLVLGLRQGKALGLMWPDLGLDAGTLLVMRSRLRPK